MPWYITAALFPLVTNYSVYHAGNIVQSLETSIPPIALHTEGLNNPRAQSSGCEKSYIFLEDIQMDTTLAKNWTKFIT